MGNALAGNTPASCKTTATPATMAPMLMSKVQDAERDDELVDCAGTKIHRAP